MKRPKEMSFSEFSAVQGYDWSPVKLNDQTKPAWMQNIPNTLINSVYASGSHYSGIPTANPQVASAYIVGGIEVFRNAPDGPSALDKDSYQVISGSNLSNLIVLGPSRDPEHWINAIPQRYSGTPTLTELD